MLVRVSRRSLPLAMLKDAIVSYGEQLSSRLLAEVCQREKLNAQSRRRAPFDCHRRRIRFRRADLGRDGKA
ncbi:MAG: hypothetical protein WKF71_11340 [Pyrinomonadaceae bacterium]